MARVRTDCTHVSFRITNPAVVGLLAQRAQASGTSPNLIARDLFTESLTRHDEVANQLEKVASRMETLNARLKQLDQIQHRLERGFYMLFRYAGRLDANQAAAAIERCCAIQPLPNSESDNVIDEEDGLR